MGAGGALVCDTLSVHLTATLFIALECFLFWLYRRPGTCLTNYTSPQQLEHD